MARFLYFGGQLHGADTIPVEVYRGGPVAGRRFGDTFDVRGAGNDTQILVSSVNTGAVEPDFISVIFTTTDAGMSWTPRVITTPGVDDDAARPNAIYQIEGTTNFDDWTDVQTVTIEPDGSNNVTVNMMDNFRFYRAVAE